MDKSRLTSRMSPGDFFLFFPRSGHVRTMWKGDICGLGVVERVLNNMLVADKLHLHLRELSTIKRKFGSRQAYKIIHALSNAP